MQKYTPVTVFMGVHQSHALRVLAESTRKDTAYGVNNESISSLTRLAVKRLIQDLEEWQDALAWNKKHEGEGVVLRFGRQRNITDEMIERYAKAASLL